MKSLLDKYTFIERLRSAPDKADKATIQQLASTYPGALRELELLAPTALTERIAALRDGCPDWAAPMEAYHRHLLRILQAKARAAPCGLSENEYAQLQALPGGRLSQLAIAWTCQQCGLGERQLREMLWPLVSKQPPKMP